MTSALPSPSEERLIFPLVRGRMKRDLLGQAAFSLGSVALAVLPDTASQEIFFGIPARAFLWFSAAFWFGVFGWCLLLLIRGEPTLVVDNIGFHSRSRTIPWEAFSGLLIARGRWATRLTLVSSGRRKIVLTEKQFARPLAEIVDLLRQWSSEHREGELVPFSEATGPARGESRAADPSLEAEVHRDPADASAPWGNITPRPDDDPLRR